ncbi:MAG TPA: hypothetical protein VM032_19520 [Vicinamibacterales bacterium]|nr:hypothetical protein [Vicinamibacterales bacterium]
MSGLQRVHLAVLVTFLGVAVATLAPGWNADGWPMNHDGPGFAQRVHIYARHLAAFDLLPIWSSADASGFGSPMPLFYHRLFYVVAAPLALATGSVKFAVLVTLASALVAGAAGVYRLTRLLGAGRLAATFAGCSLIAANYTVTNWLVRGAVAELTGAMLVPWTLFYFVQALRAGRMPVALGAVLALLWHAHSVMAFHTALVLAISFVVLAIVQPAHLALLRPRTAWLALAAFALLVGPHLAAMAVAQSRYDLSRFVSWPLHPSYQFRPLAWYFWDRHWTWGHTVSGLTLQIDLPMLALLGVGIVAAAGRGPLREWSVASLAPVALPAALCLALQMHWTERFYLYVPGAAFIQFPWRLLAVLTPALIALAFTVADRALPHDARLLALAASAAWMVAGSGAFVPIVDPRFPLDPPSLRGVDFSGYREYEPVTAPRLAELRSAVESRWRELGCGVVREAPDEETTTVSFDVTCDRSAVIPLPVYASVLHRAHVSRFDRAQRCADVPGVPSTCGVTVPAGHSVVQLSTPTLLDVPRYWLGAKGASRQGSASG